MRRADRLLQIIQILRRASGPLAASRIAEELEVSLRTLYRDMASLESTGVPVRGEAGVGYVLEDGYDMPPLMFTATELEAIMLGTRMVDGRVDEELSRAAKDVIAKIAAVLPSNLKSSLIDAPLFAPQFMEPEDAAFHLPDIRRALRTERQVYIRYRDLSGKTTERTIWPVLFSFFQSARVLIGWCTLREDFRSFRTDGILSLEVLEKRSPRPRKTMHIEWQRSSWAKYQSEQKEGAPEKVLRGV